MMDSFLINKIIASWLMPLPMIIILLILGLFFYAISRKKMIAISMITVATLILILTSLKPVSEPLIHNLEWQKYPLIASSEKPIDYIIVLGCGHTGNKYLPPTMQLNECSLTRVVEAVRIYQTNPDALIIFSGYGGYESESSAHVAANAAISLGIPEKSTIIFPEPRNTHEEALAMANTIKGSKFALVTSSSHMKRAIRYFKKEGLDPIPAPASYYAKSNPVAINYQSLSPAPNNIEAVSRRWYELLSDFKQKISSL